MELDEMKNTWQAISHQAKNQESKTTQLIEQMSSKNYHSKINRIRYSEYIGSIVCFGAVVYLIINFTKIESPLMQGFAIVALLLLFILPILSLKSLRGLNHINPASKTYLEAIEDFGNRKLRFQKLQKLNVSLGLFLMVIAIPVLSAIQGKDLSLNPYFWTAVFPISIIFFLGFAYWVLRSYNKVLTDTERMLSDLDS